MTKLKNYKTLPEFYTSRTPSMRTLKNLLARMIGEMYYPNYNVKTYSEADIPMRDTVDKYLPKIIKLLV